jgi:hypothetical protein
LLPFVGCKGSDRDLAAPFEGAQEGAFGRGSGTGELVLEWLEQSNGPLVVSTDGDPESTLPCCREPRRCGEHLTDQIEVPESRDTGMGQDGGVEVAFAEPAEAGIEVSAEVVHDEIGAQVTELRAAAERTRADPCAGREFGEGTGPPGRRNQHVAWVFPIEYRTHDEPIDQDGRHVFERVDRRIDLAREDGAVEFLGEEALIADLGEGHIGDPVPRGLEDPDLDGQAGVELFQASLDEFRLEECESATAGPET